jgi:hypothetical protein
MIQLNQSEATNIVALYPDSTYNPANPTLLAVRFSGSQDYDRFATIFMASIYSNNYPWIVVQLTGSEVPNPSGQYTLQAFQLVATGSAVWNTDADQWELANTTWDDATYEELGDLITTVRAFVSGSDVTPITQYVSPDENGAYTTYLG